MPSRPDTRSMLPCWWRRPPSALESILVLTRIVLLVHWARMGGRPGVGAISAKVSLTKHQPERRLAWIPRVGALVALLIARPDAKSASALEGSNVAIDAAQAGAEQEIRPWKRRRLCSRRERGLKIIGLMP